MTRKDFIEKVQDVRGGLKRAKEVALMEIIYDDGIHELRELAYGQKQMGIKNIAELTKLQPLDQYGLFKWLHAKGFKATKNEMELKVGSYDTNNQ